MITKKFASVKGLDYLGNTSVGFYPFFQSFSQA